ncbi:MAG: hypothetical protein Q8Q09_11440 [Deltaproteobacteria bacterium]|nr:hypothetical protein [Deltaproteobacteria bacterium]
MNEPLLAAADDALTWLPATTRELIEQTRSLLATTLGADLEAICLIGSAVNPSRGDRARSPELLCIVAHDRLAELADLAKAIARPMQQGVRVRLLTREELDRSSDVFALEIAEWKARHRLIHGADPFATVTWTRADLRRAIETELRGLTRRVRNRVLAGMAVGPARDNPARAVADGVDCLLVAAHHVLVMVDGEAPTEESALLSKLSEKTKVDVSRLVAVLPTLRAANTSPSTMDTLNALLAITEATTRWVDGLEGDA